MMDVSQKLVLFAGSQVGKPFVWGETDCVMLGLKCVDIMTGSSDWLAYAGRWSNEAEARAYFATETPFDYLAWRKAEEVTPGFEQIGDVMLAQTPEWPFCVHIVVGAKALSSSPSSGVNLIPVALIRETAGVTIWRVH